MFQPSVLEERLKINIPCQGAKNVTINKPSYNGFFEASWKPSVVVEDIKREEEEKSISKNKISRKASTEIQRKQWRTQE